MEFNPMLYLSSNLSTKSRKNTLKHMNSNAHHMTLNHYIDLG